VLLRPTYTAILQEKFIKFIGIAWITACIKE